ncbi:beta-ketoacyl-ACP synthase, partial [Methylobacterium sp. WL103]|uniref:beta-ketoacyl-ACP synthase n=1 Tax=Methylobacterium sp. WL103 TaxID=2603891 RepID=UPI001AEEC6BC
MSRAVVVTGIGLVSCVGEGLAAHLDALDAGAAPRTDAATFAPYPVHPAPAIAWDGQIPKKSDQRQMEAWQRLGVYAAGLALDSAGVKDDAGFKQALHLVVAAGGGERDYAVDGAILTGLREAEHAGAFLNERLQNDLRPTLFLAQLSNLLAGNIAIVHGVTGASRTFMGEEASGVDALRIGQARIASGQIDAMLVGGSYSAERPDVMVVHEMGGFLRKPDYAPVFDRADAPGFILGSCAAFLMLESAETAAARGARALARTEALFTLAAEIHRRIEAQKAKLGALDFDDLIHKTLDLLSRVDAAWVLYKLDRGVDHVLVDEAQDTNPQQWRILDRLTAEFATGAGAREQLRTRFAVGDPKQSIYSFQGAEPREFATMHGKWRGEAKAAKLKFEDVALGLSFRSTLGVLRAVDATFGVAEHYEGLGFEDKAVGTVHTTARAGAPGTVELWPVAEPVEEVEPDAWA